jgi:hypothetical protein
MRATVTGPTLGALRGSRKWEEYSNPGCGDVRTSFALCPTLDSCEFTKNKAWETADPLPPGGEMSPTRSTCERRSAMILGLAGDVAFAGLIRPSWLQ